jgi:putative ABC transport system ATP-binding protein
VGPARACRDRSRRARTPRVPRDRPALRRREAARALVNDPEIIFADEPTGNLDSRSGQMVMETIQDLNENHGHTIILITHETSTAEHANRIIRIRDGRIESDEQVRARRRASAAYEK